MPSARHSKETPEWYTPGDYVRAARQCMGGIDLDPASCPEANKVVQARHIYTARNSGLLNPWNGRVFINPPGGLVKEFWRKLINEYATDDVTEFVWIGYSIEQLQTLQCLDDGTVSPLDPAFALCIPRRRIAFVESAARARVRRSLGKQRASSPSHANYIAYGGENPDAFRVEFRAFGAIR